MSFLCGTPLVRFAFCIHCFGVLAYGVQTPSTTVDRFNEGMKKHAKLEKTIKINGLKDLLEEYPNHPDRAKAMLAIAGAYESSIPSKSVVPDYGKRPKNC